MSIYKNVWRMPIHIPIGDINQGFIKVEDTTLIIDYYGDGRVVERFDDFDARVLEKILADWKTYQDGESL